MIKGKVAEEMTEENQELDAFEDASAEQEEQVVEEEATDEQATLAAELEEARGQAAEYLDGWQRARAEFANYRRRQEQQRKQMDVAAKSDVLFHLLPVMDDLGRACEAVPEGIEGGSWITGLSMVHQKWLTALHKVGVSVLSDEPGDAFDPSIHEALTHEPSQEFDEGSIIQVVQRGYKLNDVILRPAQVRVSSGKVQADQEQAEIDEIEGA